MDSTNGDSDSLAKKVEMLEKKLEEQENEITLLKSGLSEALRKLSVIESGKPNAIPISCNQKQIQSRHSGSSTASSSKDQKPSTPRNLPSKQTFPTSPKSVTDQKKWPSSEGPSNTPRTKGRDSIPKDAEGLLKFQLRGRTLNFFAPSALGGDFLSNGSNHPPKEKLSLEWVYGYRGKDARSNVFLLPTGEIVYFVAAVAVLYNVEERTQRHYVGHTDDIRCLAIHPDKVTIATGQVAGHSRNEGKATKKSDSADKSTFLPHVRIWNSINLMTLKIIGIGDFERAVACLSFSKQDGGTHLAVVDDANDHVLSVWDWQRGEKGTKIAENKSYGDPVYFAEFHPFEANFLVVCGKGQISFWTLESCTLIKKPGIFEKHEKPKFVTCLAFNENGEVISGDSSGNICVWGKGTNRIQQEIPGAHEGGLFTICMLKDGSFLSGGKDRKIVKWEALSQEGVGGYKKSRVEQELPESYGSPRHLTRDDGIEGGLIVGTLKNVILRGSLGRDFTPIVQGHTDELWGLAEHPNQNQFMTCGYDKSVYLWDSLSRGVVWSKDMPEGCHAVAIQPGGQVAVVTGVSPRFYVLDLSTHEVLSSHADANERIECLQFSPNGSLLACGSRDNYIYIYSVSEECKMSKVAKLSGHSSFILHLDWSSDGSYLQSNSGDYEILFWNMSTYKQVLSSSSLRDVEWATDTCTLSFNVCGVWPEGADGTDVNACSKSHVRSLLASADDYGKVSLFNFPSFMPKSRGLNYQGHSSHVTNVKFLHDDSRLISVGGKDASVIQWQIVDSSDSL